MTSSSLSILKPLEAGCLTGRPNIRHGFFTRQGGVSEGLYGALNCGLGSSDQPERVLENRNRVARHLKATHEGVVTLFQIHGTTALTVDRPQPRQGLLRADAVVTRTPGLAIGVLTADCTPVLFADPEAGVVAAAHAGWRGAVGGIVESAIIEMERQGASRDRIRAALGPAISAASYEVGPDFENEVLNCDPSAADFFLRDGAKPHFDLPGYVYHRLSKAGLGWLEAVSPCTLVNESLFFSFRRSTQSKEPDYGRQISAIVVA